MCLIVLESEVTIKIESFRMIKYFKRLNEKMFSSKILTSSMVRHYYSKVLNRCNTNHSGGLCNSVSLIFMAAEYLSHPNNSPRNIFEY